MSSTIIRDVICFTPQGRVEGDCLIENGRIAEIGRVTGQASHTIPAHGQWLWPGVIDAHVHFRDPGMTQKEDWATGSMAAVAGGVTSVMEMPNTIPSMITPERLEQKRAIARSKTRCNFGLFYGASPMNLSKLDKVRGVPALKVFMGSSTGELLLHQREELERAFSLYPGRIAVHAESEWRIRERASQFRYRDDAAVHSLIRDPEAAAEAVRVAARAAIKYGRHLHILHLSTQMELDEVFQAREFIAQRELNAKITCEVCPHHLFLNTDAYWSMESRVRVNPPLREDSDRQAMWNALRKGHIEMIATDHAPHLLKEKTMPYREAPSGMPGVQTMLPLMLDAASRGLCSYEQALNWLCHAPAKVYGIVDRGRLEVGAHADLVLIDSLMRRTVTNIDQFSKCAWTPWSNYTLTGWPTMTFVNGQLAFERYGTDKGEVLGKAGLGVELQFKPVH